MSASTTNPMSHLTFKSFHERTESNHALFESYVNTIRLGNWNLRLHLDNEVLYAIDHENEVAVVSFTNATLNDEIAPSPNDTIRVFHNENDAIKWMDAYSKVKTS